MAKRLSAFQGGPFFVVLRAFPRHGCSLTEHKYFLQYRCGGRYHPMLNEAPRSEDLAGNGNLATNIYIISNCRWRLEVRFTLGWLILRPRASGGCWTGGWVVPWARWRTENPYPAGNIRSVTRYETVVVWGLHCGVVLRFQVFWDVLADVSKERNVFVFKDRGVQEEFLLPCDSKTLWNVGTYLPEYTASQLGRS
jgi:hypothetical protein